MSKSLSKSMKRILSGTVLGVYVACSGLSAQATTGDNEQLALDMATLFRAARAVVSANQALINDPDKGDKGLSGEHVVVLAKANYEKAAGHVLAPADPTTAAGEAQLAMLAAVAEVMTQAQVLINEPGKGFKGFLPAVFAKQVADRFSQKMDGKMAIKLTAPKKYVRNRANRPDTWEREVIDAKFSSADWPQGNHFSAVSAHKGKAAYRLIIPEYYGASCLGCHGEPAGERDITGGKKEGGQLGELGGAISFVIYE